MLDVDAVEERALADDDNARAEGLRRDPVAQLRPDAGGLAGGQRDDRAPYRSSSRSST